MHNKPLTETFATRAKCPDGRRFRCLVGVAFIIAHDESSTRNGRHCAVELQRRQQTVPGLRFRHVNPDGLPRHATRRAWTGDTRAGRALRVLRKDGTKRDEGTGSQEGKTTDHPLYLGHETLRVAKRSDVIFLIDVDVPWDNPSTDILRSDVKVIQLEVDPSFSSIPVWGFHVDHAMAGCSETSLPVLNAILRRKLNGNADLKRQYEERRKRIQGEHASMKKDRDARIEALKNDKPIHPLWVSKCIGEVMDEKTLLVGETVTSLLPEVIELDRAGSFFGSPPAGHLGWGLGAAIGAKLAAPDHTVIAATGDGAYIFGAPTASHFTAQKYGVPFLTVIYNNQAWNASINSVLEFYPSGVAVEKRTFPGCDLTPSPRFELTAEACGAYAERVEEPGQLKEALKRALKVVREEKRQALLNVICKSPL